MQVEKRDGSTARRVLTAMIVDRAVLARVAASWLKEGLFKDTWCNQIGNWCVEYFLKYSKPPKKQIEALFESWATETPDKETVKLVERFLTGLSDEYKALAAEVNSEYIIDLAGKHFNTVRLERLADAIQGDVTAGKLDLAQKRVNTFGRVEMGRGTAVNVLCDKEAMRKAFESKKAPLIVYPGAVGRMFDDAFERDAFVVFQGPEKRGKSWWLIDVSWRAMEQGRKVAFFAVGDMSQDQVMRRYMTRASKRPLKSTKSKDPKFPDKPVRYPTYLSRVPESPFATADVEERHFKHDLSLETAWRACQAVVKKTKSRDLLRLSVHPNSSINIHGIAYQLQQWEHTGWTPDVVIIDYADIIAPLPGYKESRDQVNQTWMGLRGLSQSLHCCLVTATQSDADSYDADVITAGNFSEDKRKNAHVTAMFGLCQTTDEKAQGIMRINRIQFRENEFTSDVCVHVAGCLSIANPAIKSIF